MEVVGKSKAKVVLESCLSDSAHYFSDHVRIIKCNPYCANVVWHKEEGLYQWVFQVEDPRNNPIVAVFFVEQMDEPLDAALLSQAGAAPGDRCIRWVSAETPAGYKPENDHTFVGKTNSRICLRHLDECRTELHFETDITLDFHLSFPLNLMPEGVIKFMTETIMGQIMQQATDSMLCRVQADICCDSAEVESGGGRK